MTEAEQRRAQAAAVDLILAAGLILRDDERGRVEVADFGLGSLEAEGAQILTLVQTERLAVKLIALTPWQALPEHWHPRVGDDPGKEETVRHVAGDLFVYVDGPPTIARGRVPTGKEHLYTMRHELVLAPGDQRTFTPGDKHWFQAGERGAVAYSFSTTARDVLDQFTDPDVQRVTVVAGGDR
ncbi:MAG: D-lyxose/D-mannose family sugar isomerase [Spirochaetaceae bacterium]|nr:MAG: D-lyxose/D-mannose family sugar isomerase [Spirochaetaceae bacterium]